MITYVKDGKVISKVMAARSIEDSIYEDKRWFYRELKKKYPNAAEKEFNYLFDVLWMKRDSENLSLDRLLEIA